MDVPGDSGKLACVRVAGRIVVSSGDVASVGVGVGNADSQMMCAGPRDMLGNIEV